MLLYGLTYDGGAGVPALKEAISKELQVPVEMKEAEEQMTREYQLSQVEWKIIWDKQEAEYLAATDYEKAKLDVARFLREMTLDSFVIQVPRETLRFHESDTSQLGLSNLAYVVSQKHLAEWGRISG